LKTNPLKNEVAKIMKKKTNRFSNCDENSDDESHSRSGVTSVSSSYRAKMEEVR